MIDQPHAPKASAPPSSQKEMSLWEFIEENHKILSVLGVFTALAVFASKLEFQPLGNVLAILFLSLIVLMWRELWDKVPPDSV
jgi:hypothetical protein